MATWADALFAMDADWWKEHHEEVRRDFQGATYSNNDFHGRVGVIPKPFKAFGNSGAGAVAMADKAGAARVILLGYDCQKTNGLTHWHGSHPKGLGDAGSMPKWANQFARLAETLRCEVINCSRESALTTFPRMDLESALCL